MSPVGACKSRRFDEFMTRSAPEVVFGRVSALQALYIDGSTLACRVCLGLRYANQHETERDRLFRRAHKLGDRLGWRGGVADRGRGRPRGMHERTYQRLCTD